MLLEGKVALITGSVRGTGAGIARVFASEGARVVLNQVHDEGNPQQVLDTIRGQGGQAIFVQADIGDEAQVKAMLQQAESAFGQVDILVNNYAASIPRASFSASTWAAWQEQIDYTVKAAFFCGQAVLPGMQTRRAVSVSAPLAFIPPSRTMATRRRKRPCSASHGIWRSKSGRTTSPSISFLPA
jgi:3-oxoacyl-[acyl-carrier protein] reductase